MKWSPSVAWRLLSVIRAQQPTVKARRLFLPSFPCHLKLFSSLWPLSGIYPSLQNKISLHTRFKHSYFFINYIPGVFSAAKSCIKIKHCFQIFPSLGYFFPPNLLFALWNFVFSSSAIYDPWDRECEGSFISSSINVDSVMLGETQGREFLKWARNQAKRGHFLCHLFLKRVSPSQSSDYSASVGNFILQFQSSVTAKELFREVLSSVD